MTFFLHRFSRDGLDAAFSHEEDVLAWDIYYHERLETSVGAKLAERVVRRVGADGLDYTLFTEDERTALDIVLVSLFSSEHELTLWPVLDALGLGECPVPPIRGLLARAEAAGSEGLVRVLLDGRRLDMEEPPVGLHYAMLEPKESQRLAIQIRELLAAGGVSKTHTKDIEKRLLPVLDKVVADDDWLMSTSLGDSPRRRARS